MSSRYTVEILDNTRTPITRIQSFHPLNTSGQWLQYGSKLSDYGQAKFRVGMRDPAFTQFGDILVPFANHVRIYRGNTMVWSGIIVKNPVRNKNWIEVVAYTYEYMFTTVLVKHDVSTTAGDGKDNYRTFSSGTLATAIQNVLTETKQFVDSNNVLKNLSIRYLENPNFPANYTQANGSPLTGTWTFSSDMTLSFDYRDVLFVLQTLAAYPACDFIVTDSGSTGLIFDFKQFIGNKQPDLVFEYSNYGAIEDYNIIMDGESMANDLVGVAADYGNQILHATQADSASITRYGRIQGVAAFIDIKNVNALKSRLSEQLRNVSTPDGEIQVLLNDRAYPIGQWGLGDTVTLRIRDNINNLDSIRRIVAYSVKVHTTGKESVQLITNPPKEGI